VKCLLVALALAAGTGAWAQALPKPSPLMQKELDGKDIPYADWLLFHGVRTGNADYITAALKSGASLDKARNPIGQLPPLMQAVSSPAARADIVALLVKHGADAKARVSHGGTALHNTFDVEIGRVLARYGADLNARNNAGQTPLAIASRALAQLDKQSSPQQRAKVAAFHAWLKANGGVE
jgi:hypothetical protein